jgi:Amt family ammonium transporter
MAQIGVRDFAGGIVVHTTAGVSALVLALMIGRRRGFPHHALLPHSPAMTMIGAGMLWVGWFGFNGGSALAANGTAGSAILATHLAASAAASVWIALEWLTFRKATSVGIATGAVAGLATITPAAGFVTPLAAVIIGGGGAGICFWAVITTKQRFKIDDSLDVFAVHGVGGMTGSLLLSVFSPEGAMGHTLGTQAIGVAVIALWSAIASFLLAKLAALAIPMRVDPEAEQNGLDLSYHGERAYELD